MTVAIVSEKKYINFIRYLICNTRCMYFHGHMNHQRGILFYLQSFHSRDFTVDANAFFYLGLSLFIHLTPVFLWRITVHCTKAVFADELRAVKTIYHCV